MRLVFLLILVFLFIHPGPPAQAYSAGDACSPDFPNGILHGANNTGDYNFLICRTGVWRKWMNYNTASGQMNILNLLTGDAGDITSDTDGTASISLDGDLRILGDGYINGVTLIVSDHRVKRDITPLVNSLDKITRLNGVEYTKITDTDRAREIGVIAQ